MTMAGPVAVTVLTGFLGAGKTSLLNRLLKQPGLQNTAVIVNEFGEIGIDHLLVEAASDELIELSDGCLCCTIRGDLVDTLADLADRMQTGRIGQLERVVIETTGLADPVSVLQALMGHPALVQAYRLDGVVTVADAVNGQATIERYQEAARQVAVADRLVLSKTDLAAKADVQALKERLSRLNPGAPQLEAASAAPAQLIECGLYDPARRHADIGRWLRDEHLHDHRPGCDHHHDSGIATFALTHEAPLSFSAIEAFVDLLLSNHGENLLRMKGIVELAEDRQRPLVLHCVQKLLHPPARLCEWPDARRGTRLVLIGSGINEDHVRRLFAAIAGQPSVDTPDRAAMTENPLAVPGWS